MKPEEKLLAACKAALEEAEIGDGSLSTPIIRQLYEAIESVEPNYRLPER